MQISLADRKIQAIELIAKLENEDLLTLIEQLLTGEEAQSDSDWADALSDEDKAGIREGLSDLDSGRSVNYEDFKKEMKKRFP